ncbi:MAG: response regulator [Pirellulales bacterium]|nr:response regulator [Pirellulales bacterium]MBX3435671.1 response regulator [Pirellulales bacterium]
MPVAKVFIVDDDASVRQALDRLLRSAGMSVRTFAGSGELLATMTAPPDCLILDVRMPGMTGPQLQERLWAESLHVPIVFITAHDEALPVANAASPETIAFLHKPFEDHALLDAVQRGVALRSAP